MTYTEKELDQFLHGISLSLLSKKSAQHWRYDEETAKEIEWLEALERKVRADKADRKTESNSEKPNNSTISKMEQVEQRSCDTCKNRDIEGWKNPCLGCIEFTFYEPKTEPTISKMEQVDKDINVRSKDCETCKWGEWYRKGYDITMMDDECGGCCSWSSKWTPKDEQQTERPTRCSECKVWRRCFKEKPSYNMIKSRCPIDEPQTERSE